MKMTRMEQEAELRRLLNEKEKQETKLKVVQRQIDRLVAGWKSIEPEPVEKGAQKKRAIRVSPEERARRAERMKTYWQEYRKKGTKSSK